MSDFLTELNPQQKQAVASPPGPILVLAGPGSGKTRVLTYRVAYLIAALEVPAYQIMAVTFTNKAAREMGNRIRGLLGERVEGLWLGTFHAICGRILRRESAYLPVDSNFVIFDEDDQHALIKRVIKEHRLNEKDFNPRQVLTKISNAKNDLQTPEEFPLENYRDEIIQSFYRAYQAYLVASNAMDFDDMLLYTASLLKNQPDVRQKYSRRFKHILVDEFQDTNQAQYDLLFHLSAHLHNLFLVGDEDQSIYRWRGADYKNVERFRSDFPDHVEILLEQNYRSTQTILDSATTVINKNVHRTKKVLFTERSKGEPVVVYEALDDYDEAAYVVDIIARQFEQKTAGESDFAIMYRTNAQSRLLEEAFRRANMNYRLVGAQRFYGRREVKDMIAFLRLIYNPKDEVSLSRVINLPPRGIGAVTLQRLQEIARESGVSSGEVLLSLSLQPDSEFAQALGSFAARLLPFSKLLIGWRSSLDQASLTGLFDQVLLDTDYEVYIKAEDDVLLDRWANVLELRSVLLEYEEAGLDVFLETMALVADQDTLPETIDAPTLLTLHSAKGLEFPQVFIIGLDEHILPHSRSLDEKEELAEERRLMYVGMTRAKDRLYLTRAHRRRTPYGNYETMLPSRFLMDLPANLTQGRVSRVDRWDESDDYQQYQWNRTYGSRAQAGTPKPPTKREQRFYSEMHVRHPVYGEGIVRNSRLEYGDETVEVYFDGLGLKALVASMSRLEIIEE